MWLFTLHGFFSVVNLRHGFDGLPPAAPTFMVRARRRAHLVALQAAHPERLGGLDILDQPASVYVLRPNLNINDLKQSPTAEQLLSVGVDIWAMPGVPSLRVAGYVGLGLVDPVPALPEARIPCPELVLSR